MAPDLRELIALSLLAGPGFGLALARDDLFFPAVFGGASAMTIIDDDGEAVGSADGGY
jgi:hypothetical protein